MFGGFGDTFKNLTNQVQKEVEDLAIEKKKEAQTMLESQVKKTGDALMNTKAGVEKSAFDAKKSAIDGFDKECSAAEKGAESAVKETKQAAVEAGSAAAGALGGVESQINSAVGGAVQQVGQVVDAKIKEADHYLDEKREEVVRQVRGATDKATGQAEEGVGAVLGKAKGLFNL